MPAPPDLDAFFATRLRLSCVAETPIALEPFAGSTLRGGLAHAYQAAVCTREHRECRGCDAAPRCAYPPLFEPSPPADATRLRTLDQIPRAYVVEAPWFGGAAHRFEPGDAFEIGLVLFGTAVDRGDALVDALAALGRRGLGPARGRYRVDRVAAASADPASIAARVASLADATEGALTVRFTTPLRVKVEGRYVREPAFVDVVRAALRRASSVIAFHCGGELDADFRGLIDAARAVSTRDATLARCALTRVSGRQARRIDMDGVVGHARYDAGHPAAIAPFLPLLAAAEWLHVGKGAVMGLGQIVVEP